MYVPKVNQESDRNVLHHVIEQHPLATLIINRESGLEINHVPFLLDTTKGPFGTLYGHVARASPVALGASSATLIFNGPNAYVSPSWYPSKQATGKVVPTWNYVVMHVHGSVTLHDSREWLQQHIAAMTARHEQQVNQTWQVSDAPDDFIETLCSAIVGIEIRIERWEGKTKISQNRSEADQQGVINGLRETQHEGSLQMASFMCWYKTLN